MDICRPLSPTFTPGGCVGHFETKFGRRGPRHYSAEWLHCRARKRIPVRHYAIGYETSKILADDGFVIDDWKDLNTVSCLIVGSGGFQILADEAVFTSNSEPVFRLLGKPFSSSVGDTGEAVIELFDNGCTNLGWTWTVVSVP